MKNRETAALLKRQAEWQASRKSQSWGDKLRQCIKARDSLRGFCKDQPKRQSNQTTTDKR